MAMVLFFVKKGLWKSWPRESYKVLLKYLGCYNLMASTGFIWIWFYSISISLLVQNLIIQSLPKNFVLYCVILKSKLTKSLIILLYVGGSIRFVLLLESFSHGQKCVKCKNISWEEVSCYIVFISLYIFRLVAPLFALFVKCLKFWKAYLSVG